MFRSLLYVPADSARFIAKAHERGADAIILDLEDAVVEANKPQARAALAESVRFVGQGGTPVLVRINAGEIGADDIAAATEAGVFGIVMPKTETVDDVLVVCEKIAQGEMGTAKSTTRLLLLIESACGVLNAQHLAASSPRVLGLALGSEDLALEMGAKPTQEFLLYPKLALHYAAKAEGIASFGLLDTIASYTDLDALRNKAQRARAFGFDGASCVHPTAVPILNAAFVPLPEEISWARDIVKLAEKHGQGPFKHGGRMVDRPVILRAQKILTVTSGG